MPKLDEATIFNVARHIEAPEARRLYIEQACAADQRLQVRVESLLRVHEREWSFLKSPAEGILGAGQLVGEGPGTQIGPYKLMEQIGEGGFGIVFMAEQHQPVRRKVALKILKPGMDSSQIAARFEAERQALALMDHPNIAHVLDGGTAPSGRPYFVMDLVKGIPITQYCDDHQLAPSERLALFLPICKAVQHAHQKGIIHRDLKPTNMLVAIYDGKPVPKVIDFGVAKALGRPLTDRTLFTGFAGIIGTLEYMSPEQAEFNSQDIDTRSDIYSLGVVLYELLTGTTPLTKERIKAASTTELLRIIREEEPPKPSTRHSEARRWPKTVSDQPPTETQSGHPLKAPGDSHPPLGPGEGRDWKGPKWGKEIRGELDWIVMKCLEKDRTRRYETANGLARDVERYLNGEAVEACPPSTVYRLRKFARKYKTLLSAAAAFVFLLTAATIVSTWQALRAMRAEQTAIGEREHAETEADRARRHLYVAHMNMAQNAWDEARVGRVLGLLEHYRPKHRDEDLRGFEWYYWRKQTDSAIRTITGHSDLVSSVAYSPNGQQLASASRDATVKVWDAKTGREISTLKGHAAEVSSVMFGPDGQRLASASMDGTLKLWDTKTGQVLHTFKGHRYEVGSVAFSPDGLRLASGSHDGTVKVWNTATGRMTLDYKGHGDLVLGVAFSPDGKWLASGSKDQTVKVWEAETGNPRVTLKGHTNEVKCVAFNPDGKQLVSGSLDHTVRVWDVASGRERHRLTRHTDRIFGVAFSPDGKRIASASVDRTVRLWDAASGAELMSFKGHTSWVSCVAFSPDGKHLASSSFDRTIKQWDVSTGEEMVMMKSSQQFLRVAFSPDGTRLASGGQNGIVKVWDAASGLETAIMRGHGGPVDGVAFSPDGKQLVSASRDTTVRKWDAATGRQVLAFKGPTGMAFCVAFSPDGKLVAASGEDHSVRVWDAQGGRETLTLHGHSGAVRGVAFSPDSKQLASASEDHMAKVWDTTSGLEKLTLKGHASDVWGVAFSPDGRQLASAGGDGTVRVWDLVGGQEMQLLTAHTDGVSSVSFSPDGRRLASASADKMVKVWDTSTGEETLTLKGHTYGVPCVAFSPDGWRLASAGFDGTLRVWDARPWTAQLRVEQEARGLIQGLLAKAALKEEVVRRIDQDKTLSAELRAEAAHMIERWQEDPARLNNASWVVVSRPDASPESYAFALRQAQAACRLALGNDLNLNTLGVALYRCGKFQEALDTLVRSDKLNSASRQGRQRADVAFLAMAQYKLGQKAKGQALLADLRQLMKKSDLSGQAEAEGFLREATELIDGKR